MLRLAFARPSRVILSSLVAPSRASWIRYNSTAPSVPPSPPNVITASEDAELDVPSSDVGSIPSSEGPFVNLKLLDPNRLPLTKPLGENFTETEHAATLIHGRGFHKAFHHPRTHDIPVANIQFRSHHPELLDLFTHFATHAASSLGIPVSRVATLPTKRTLWTVLRSPHVHKKSQENFERKVHKRGIKAWDADEEVVDRWCQYMRKHALGGVGMRVTKWKRMPLGIGKRMLVDVEKGREQSGSDSQKVKALAEKIAAEEMAKGGSCT